LHRSILNVTSARENVERVSVSANEPGIRARK
jgi:hypothetical protein